MFLYLKICIVLLRSNDFICCVSGHESERLKSLEYCSIPLDEPREKSTFEVAVAYESHLHHNEVDGAFSLETVTSSRY
jgi:hypothetical protein